MDNPELYSWHEISIEDSKINFHPLRASRLMLLHHYYQQAILAEREGRYAAALGLFKVCRSVPESDAGDILFHMGWCHEHQDGLHSVDALEFYKCSAATAWEVECRINAHFRAGWLLYHGRLIREAASMFEKAIAEGERFGCRNDPYRHALYWNAVCLEINGKYLEAIRQYRVTQTEAPELKAEAMYREMQSLTAVGKFQDALTVCREFAAITLDKSQQSRFRYLADRVLEEESRLEEGLSQKYAPSKPGLK